MRTLVEFLTRAEVDALLADADRRTWYGCGDHAFMLGGGTDRVVFI